MIRTLPLLVLLASCGGTRLTYAPGDLARSVHPQGKFHVVVIDVSESMDDNDPRHYNETGAHLAIALAGAVDNLGAVSFGSYANILAAMRSLGDRGGRRALHDEVGRAPRRGQTNYVDALQKAQAMLSAAKAPAGSSVIFLTDGLHNTGGSEYDVLEEVQKFRDRDWRIYPIGLTEGADSPLLRDMAVKTRGAHFPVRKAEELMHAFLTILGQIHNFMFFDGKPEPVHLLPGADRLVYVVIKRSKDATVSSTLRDGLAVDPKSPNFYKHPEAPDPRSDLELVSVQDPPSGVWDIVLQGDAIVGAILQRPPFVIRLDESLLKADYYEDEPVELALLIEGGGGDVLRHVREKGRASAVLRSQTALQDMAKVDLRGDGGAGGLVRFTGTARTRPAKGYPELQTIIATFYLPEKGGGLWRRETRVSVLVKPGARQLALRRFPERLDYGPRWTDAGEGTLEILLKSTRETVGVRANSPSPAVKLSSGQLTATTEGTRLLVKLDPSQLKEGLFETWVELEATLPNGEKETHRVPIRVNVAQLPTAFREAQGLRIGRFKPGQTAELPAAPKDLPASFRPLVGPGGVKIEVARKDGRDVAVIPPDAPPGTYKGEVEVVPPGFSEPRRVPVSLDVLDAPFVVEGPKEEIVIRAEKAGTYEKEIELKLDFTREVDVKLEPQDLKGKEGLPPFRSAFIGLVPASGDWDGKKLAPGKAVRAKLQVTVKSDHVNGEYRGRILIQAPGAGAAELPLKVVVQLPQ